ncbi:hypothetical protein SAMN04487911_12027 [Arenibacter nanhaiticus]|uniref:Lipocalin-like domain-containing protein n=1 Tax=Arenibacter nanhaiticus TaxID=558155 RepID=A0A1M6J2J3_9FLAO|nr:lipocalin family protein [Arenibacter nanhaiticus]SHJ40950.1 hypothetical protein SAMN04487911_12027 [Arenibacter nanhaiticus]
MRNLVVIFVLIIASSCSTKVSKADLNLLNGYWEIKKVTFPDGSTKAYTVNTSIDYIELKDTEGFRKKMYPKFDGTYETSNDAEYFSIYEKDGVFTLHYKTDLSEWQEQVISISENSFTVSNRENTHYQYKRFQPINITE